MSLFVDKNHRRKSPIAIAGFFATLLDLCIYGVLYALLAEPLYRHVALSSPAACAYGAAATRCARARPPTPCTR